MLVRIHILDEGEFFFRPDMDPKTFLIDPEITLPHHYAAILQRDSTVATGAVCIHLYIETHSIDKSLYKERTITPALKHFIKCHDKLFPYSPVFFLEVNTQAAIKFNILNIYPYESMAYHYHVDSAITFGKYPWTCNRSYFRVMPPNRSRRKAFFMKTYHYPF